MYSNIGLECIVNIGLECIVMRGDLLLPPGFQQTISLFWGKEF